jgi:hypothetical protein
VNAVLLRRLLKLLDHVSNIIDIPILEFVFVGSCLSVMVAVNVESVVRS